MRTLVRYAKENLSRCLEQLKESPYIFICLVLLNLPYVTQHAFELQRDAGITPLEYIRSVCSASLRTIFFALLLDLLLKAIPFKQLRRFAQATILAMSSVLFLLDTFALWCYRCVVDKGMLTVLLATNPREASEYLGVYVFQKHIAFGLVGTLLLMASLWIILRHVTKRKAILITLLVVSFACSLKFTLYLSHYSSLVRYGIMLTEVAKEKQAYDALAARIGTQEIVLTKNESSIPYVIFVLGESTSRNHMALYGYHLPTTTHLDARAAEKGCYVFQDVISHHTHTSAVLEELFTFCRAGAPGHWFEYGNVFDIVKAAGYHTAWISNQESFGVWGNVANHYADRCDYKKYTMLRDSTNERSSQYDEALLPLLDAWLNNASGKNLCVLHLLGTHYEYAYRYPAPFNHFSEADETGNQQKEKRVRAEYDNAVLYNDYIINEIIRRFEDRTAILIYVSDHAENVYDERDTEAGHDEINANRYMAEIPMIVWMSAHFRATYPDLERRIALSTDRPFMTDDMIHVLLDIMGIETKEYDPTKSVINEQFDANRVRIYGKNNDYEKERRGIKTK